MSTDSNPCYKLRILHTESSCGWGGQEIRILTESAGMIARGHAVTLACPPEAKIFSEATRYGVPSIALPIARKRWRGLLALRALLEKTDTDVVITHSSTDSWLTALACASLKNGPPIVRTRHISSPIPNNMTSRWIYSRAPSHIVTTGEALRGTLITQFGLLPHRVTSIPTGIDTLRFQPGNKTRACIELGLNPDLNYVGIIATLRSWKGHRFLVEAFASLNAPDWNLVIVGDGPQKDSLRTQIQALGLSGRIHQVGQQNNAERWMQALDIFCLPSYANEGVPQAILQAMLTGLPIVTTPVGAILEAVTDRETALIVEPRSRESIAIALNTLMGSADLRRDLGNRARQMALSSFSLEGMLDRMEQIFLELLGK